jgi:sugar-specific transcriptional regulator TrmB
MDDENLKILKKMGLTEYESKAYLALISLISSKADTISKTAEVPRSKIYPVLESLEHKRLIKIRQGRPLEYDVIDPSEALKNYKEEFLKQLDILEGNLVEIYDNKLPAVNTPIQSIEDIKKIVQKQNDILNKSKKVVLIRLGFILPSNIDSFKKLMIKLVKGGVRVKILAVSECVVDGVTINLKKILSQLPVEVKYVKLPSAQLIIRDYKEMMLVFAENSGKSIQNANMVGLYNTYSTIISNYSSAFNKKWSMSE